MKSVKIHRRTMLRGLQAGGVALALPLLEAMHDDRPNIEGLVFRSMNTPGFSDTSIVRCRKKMGGG